MNLEDLKADLEKGDMIYRGTCHDCGIPVESKAIVREDGAIVVSGGSVYKIQQGVEGDRYFFKCPKCFNLDRTLRNYQTCEMYSRIVGYLRPVNQWNKGKLQEFKMRKEFTNTKGS